MRPCVAGGLYCVLKWVGKDSESAAQREPWDLLRTLGRCRVGTRVGFEFMPGRLKIPDIVDVVGRCRVWVKVGGGSSSV